MTAELDPDLQTDFTHVLVWVSEHEHVAMPICPDSTELAILRDYAQMLREWRAHTDDPVMHIVDWADLPPADIGLLRAQAIERGFLDDPPGGAHT